LNYLKRILYLLGPDRIKIPFLFLLFLGTSVLDLAGLGIIAPYIALMVDPNALTGPLLWLVDVFGFTHEQKSLLINLGIVLLGIFVFKTISVLTINWVIIRFSLSQQLRLRTYLMQSYQRMKYTDFLQRNSSEYIHSIQNLTLNFSTVLMSMLRSISEGVVGMVILIFLAWTNLQALVLLVILLGLMVYGYDRTFRSKLSYFGEQINLANIKVLRGINEAIEGLKEIRVLGHEKHFLNMVRKGASQMKKYYSFQHMIQTSPRYLLELTMVGFLVLFVISLVSFEGDLKLLLPTLGVFGMAALRLIPSLNLISASLIQLRVNHDGMNRLHKDIFDIQSVQNNHKSNNDKNFLGEQNSTDTFKVLEVTDLSFQYPNRSTYALKNINLVIKAGESIGFVGISGSGKTTLLDVLLGLIKPSSGSIKFNEVPLEESLSEWLSNTAYIPQMVFLMDDSLKKNIALGIDDEQVDINRLHQAIEQSQLSDLVEQLPQGLDNIVGERGIRLSGGQRQRIALARAFYHGRNVLVMDEATSALDNKTEEEIVDQIRRLKGQITTIIIAHRHSTVKHCDYIYRLDGGKIIEEGTPENILQ
jgi:ABC-type multidrug transport system fused ATPase/permease subunit